MEAAGQREADQTIGAAIDKAVFPGQQGGPLVHIIAAKAVASGEVLRPEFRDLSAQMVANAKTLAARPAGSGFRIVSGGTDNHLMLVDVFGRAFSAPRRNSRWAGRHHRQQECDSFDTNPPLKPSGIRIGTPALTTRGMKEREMRHIAKWIANALEHRNDDQLLEKIRGEVAELANQFPLYAWRRAPATVNA